MASNSSAQNAQKHAEAAKDDAKKAAKDPEIQDYAKVR
mgnify:CR=1 FL=1